MCLCESILHQVRAAISKQFISFAKQQHNCEMCKTHFILIETYTYIYKMQQQISTTQSAIVTDVTYIYTQIYITNKKKVLCI